MVVDKWEHVEVKLHHEFNLAEILIDYRVKEGKGEKIAVKCVGNESIPPGEFTFKKLMDQSNLIGNGLRNLGVDIDNRVLIVLPDIPEFITSFCGIIKIGAIPIPVNTYLTPQDYLYFLNDSRSKAVLVHEMYAEKILKIRDKAFFTRHVIIVGGEKEIKGTVSFNEMIKDSSLKLEPVKLKRDSMGYWLYSSGTTGRPKGVVHLQHDPIYCVEGYYKKCLGLNEADVVYSVSKMFFAYGLSGSLFGPMYVGGSCILDPSPPDPERTLNIIEKYRPTMLFTVPAFYNRLLSLETQRKYDVSSLKCGVSGGEPLPAEIWRKFKERFGVEIIEHIGSTEVQFAFIGWRMNHVKPGYTGVVAPGYEAKLVDEKGREVQVGEAGRLLIKGESIAAFYWEKHDKTKKTFIGEWYDTGDMFIRDSEGAYKYVGRADDLIKTMGLWVSPAEVEAALLKHPAVGSCAVVQGFDEEKLEVVAAYIVLRKEYAPSSELEVELRGFLRKEGLKGYMIPKKFVFVDELPLTATGKVQRYKLRILEREKAFGE